MATQDKTTTIAGRTLTLRFSLLAVESLREHWKLETDNDVFQRLDQMSQVRDFVAVIWAAAQSHQPDFTYQEAFQLLDEAGLEGMREAATSLMADSLPQAEDEDPDEVPMGAKTN